jgi:iron complex outermembrane receptor protein
MGLERLSCRAAVQAGVAVLALAGSQAAHAEAERPAQTPNAAAGASDPDRPALEEIIVTGERNNKFGTDVVQAGSFRGAKTLDTPLTVSVISSAVLKSQQAIELIDALRNTAGVSLSSNGPVVYQNVSIRGIAVDTRSNFKLDGSLNILSSVAFPLEDKDRVEVLKGASALYYGFSNPSGIVNLTMKRPTPEMLLNINAFGDSNGGFGQAVDFGDTWGPFGARLNGVYAHIDSGIRYAQGHRYAVSGAFDFKPTHKLTLTFDVENFQKSVVEPATFRFTAAPASTVTNLYPQLTLPPLLNPRTNFGPKWATNTATETNLLGKANYKFNRSWDLTAWVGESRLHRVRFLPTVDPSISPASTTKPQLTVSPQNGHLLNVNYGGELAGTFGVGPLVNEVLVGAARIVKDADLPKANKVSFFQDYLDPVFIPDPGIVPNAIGDTTRIDDVGYYVFDRLKFHDWLQVLGGVRKSDYTESTRTFGTHHFVQTFHASPWTYSYGAVIKPAKWASIYGTYIQGLESTPSAPTTANNAFQQLPPTKSNQKEAGIKLEPWNGLLMQVAYFDIRRGSAYVNGDNDYVLDGRARYRGGEFSLTGNVTHSLALYASATVLSAKQVSGAPTLITVDSKGKVTVSPTAVGKRIEATPKVTASFAGEYDLARLVQGLKVSAGVYYVGSQAVNALNQAFIPSYTTFDVGGSYSFRLGGKDMVLRVNGQNVTAKRYWASTGGLFLGEGVPATVKFSLAVKF